MKTVVDYQPFADTAELLASLSAELERLTAEHVAVCDKLLFKNAPQPENLTVEEAARRVAAGGSPAKHAAEVQDEWRAEELRLRERIEDIKAAIKHLPEHLEYQRQRARQAMILEMAGDVDKVKADFAKAQKAMMAAALAESALIERLVIGGFGVTEPWVTAPHWLNRQQLLLQTVE